MLKALKIMRKGYIIIKNIKKRGIYLLMKNTKEIYNQLFPDEHSKAKAFDALAEHFYHQNFATMGKAEIDLLMFSLYLNRIYMKTDYEERDSSDYTLSKILGITENRISSLKEKKELKYPSEYDWKTSFLSILDKAEIRDDKIEIYIKDHRVYKELNHAIEEIGSYSEITLTKKLLRVSFPAFLELLIMCSDDEQKMKGEFAKILKEYGIDYRKYTQEKYTLSDLLKEQTPKIMGEMAQKALGYAGGKIVEGSLDLFFEKISDYCKSRT